MPYKDPMTRRLSNREAQRRRRAKLKAEKEARAAVVGAEAVAVVVPDKSPTEPQRSAGVQELEVATPGKAAAILTDRVSSPTALRPSDPESLPIPGPIVEASPLDIPDWAPRSLIVPTGRLKGQPFTLDDWQVEFIRESFNPDITEAGISLARKNGKTGLIAAVVLWHLLNREDWNYTVTSEDDKFARRMFDSIHDIAHGSGYGEVIETFTSKPQKIVNESHRNKGYHLPGNRGISGEGEDVDLAIVDEAGLLPESSRGLWNTQHSSLTARDGLFIALGTQKTGPMFAEMRERKNMKHVAFRIYETPEHYALDDPEGWRLANPSLGTIKSERNLAARAASVLHTPADQNDFRIDELNQPIEPKAAYILELSDVQRMMERPPLERSGPCILGVDLGGSTSMSAISAFWPYVQRLEIYGCFPRLPNLQNREQRDAAKGVYIKAHSDRDLIVRGEYESNIPEFLTYVLEQLQGQHILGIGFDRFRVNNLREALVLAGLQHLRQVQRGTGGQKVSDASDDIRAFQHFAREGNLNIGRGAGLLVSALRYTRLKPDGSNNFSIIKDADNHRTDPVSASVIACGLGRPFAKNIIPSPDNNSGPACVVVGNSD